MTDRQLKPSLPQLSASMSASHVTPVSTSPVSGSLLHSLASSFSKSIRFADGEDCSIIEPCEDDKSLSTKMSQCCSCNNIAYLPYDICHVFCRGCLRKIAKGQNVFICPVCNTTENDIDKLTESKTLIRLIMDATVKCVFSRHGCSWSGKIGCKGKNYAEHVQQCASCLYCKKRMTISEKLLHERICSKRSRQCNQCKHYFYLDQIAAHYNGKLNCANMMACVNSGCDARYCQESIDGGQEQRTHQLECKHELITCSICDEKVKKIESNLHIMTNLNSHFCLLLNANPNSYMRMHSLYSDLQPCECNVKVYKSIHPSFGVKFSGTAEYTFGKIQFDVESFDAIAGPLIRLRWERKDSFGLVLDHPFAFFVQIDNFTYQIFNQTFEMDKGDRFYQKEFVFTPVYALKDLYQFSIKLIFIEIQTKPEKTQFIEKAKFYLVQDRNKQYQTRNLIGNKNKVKNPNEIPKPNSNSSSTDLFLFDSLRPMVSELIRSSQSENSMDSLVLAAESSEPEQKQLNPSRKNRRESDSQSEIQPIKLQRINTNEEEKTLKIKQ